MDKWICNDMEIVPSEELQEMDEKQLEIEFLRRFSETEEEADSIPA